MAAPSITSTKRPARRAKTAARQTLIERVRQGIPGEGMFLVGSIDKYPKRSYPAPEGMDHDLSLEPGRPVVLDQGWLASPLLIRDFQAMVVKLEYVDDLPIPEQLDPDPETLEGLPPTMKALVRTIGEMPFTQPYRDNLRLAEHIGRTGIPVKNSRVTKTYLRGEYAVFLRAVQAFETRRQARPEVLDLLAEQLARIESF